MKLYQIQGKAVGYCSGCNGFGSLTVCLKPDGQDLLMCDSCLSDRRTTEKPVGLQEAKRKIREQRGLVRGFDP